MRGLITVDKLSKGKSTPMLNVSLDKIFNKYKSYKHVVKKIRSDRESVFLATENHLNQQGVLYEKSAPGQHVGKVERAIRTLKGRYRSVLNSLQYTLPDSLQESLNLDVVQMLNITPNVHTGNSNPRELTAGVKVDASKVLRATFGDLVIAHTPNNPKNAKSKSEIGIVVGRDFTDSGTIKFWGLESQEVVARQSFTPISIMMCILKIQSLQLMKHFNNNLMMKLLLKGWKKPSMLLMKLSMMMMVQEIQNKLMIMMSK